MKTNIIDVTWSYGNNKVTLTATVQVTDDANNELWTDSISKSSYVSSPTGWYDLAITELIVQAQKIKDQYVSNISKVLAETKKADVAAILADVQTRVQGGIV